MDSQLNELIETIKRDGVQTAEKQAEQIVEAAKESAQKTVDDAERNAREIIAAANAEREKIAAAGEETLKQSARDLVLSVQARLTEMFKAVITESVQSTLDDQVLEKTILAVVEAWTGDKDAALSVILSEGDLARLEAVLRDRLRMYIEKGVEIRSSASVKSGFRVEMKNGTLYYDFTADAIAEALSVYAGPRLGSLLRESVQGA
jgi:V/A-type H+/Na+-transporting ATPase subunit E